MANIRKQIAARDLFPGMYYSQFQHGVMKRISRVVFNTECVSVYSKGTQSIPLEFPLDKLVWITIPRSQTLLTAGQERILKYYKDNPGITRAQISYETGLAIGTIQEQTSRARKRLGFKTTKEMVDYLIKEGYL